MGKKQKNKIKDENYLERVPRKNQNLRWKEDNEGLVTIEVDNRGLFNKIAQKIFKKPAVSFVHLDGLGSFVWKAIDGESNIIKIGESVKQEFGEKAEPLYMRLVEYFAILERNGFISFTE